MPIVTVSPGQYREAPGGEAMEPWGDPVNVVLTAKLHPPDPCTKTLVEALTDPPPQGSVMGATEEGVGG